LQGKYGKREKITSYKVYYMTEPFVHFFNHEQEEVVCGKLHRPILVVNVVLP
jgi:hypothetical protein